jgi:two-component system sensor kinase FixL
MKFDVGFIAIRYGLCVLSVAIALAITQLLEPYTTLRTPLFYIAIIGNAWFGGAGPGLLAVILSSLLLDDYFNPVQQALGSSVDSRAFILLFSLSALLACWMTVKRSNADKALKHARDELEMRVEQRTFDLRRATEELQTEIAERQRGEAALQERANLLDLTHDSIFVRDIDDDVISYWNRGAEDLYGWKKKDAFGRVSHELMSTMFPGPLEEIKAELTRTGRWEGELIHTRRDGTQLIIASRWALQRNGSGEPIAILEANNDITQRKRSERELWRLQLEMGRVERLATLGRMAAAIAHELGTPLNSVMGYAQLLSQEPLPESARRRLNIIESQLQRMEGIIHHYLSHTRGSPPKREINIEELVRDTLLLLNPILQQSTVQIATEFAERLPAISGDEASLQRVLINLIDNAVAASKERGRIYIKTAISPSSAGKCGGITIEVTDNGVGIPPEMLPKIFDLFVTSKPPGKGTGLGLAICQEIIKAHGGTIKVSSQVGEGTSVKIFLPAAESSRATISQQEH